MNPGLVVKLRPAGPWRIGPDSGARNRVDFIYHSDSLYSAVTSAMSRLGSLDAWLDATARRGQTSLSQGPLSGPRGQCVSVPDSPAVCFSSCFPFLDEIGFVVPPRTVWPPVSRALVSARVRWKSARFVPLGVVQAILSGQRLDDNHWTVDGASECLVPAGRPGPFRTGVRWSAAVDRLSGSTERHSTACIEFRPGAGLWTVVSFADDAAHARWIEPVKAAFRLLADTGFGGERSRGWGRAESPEFIDGTLPDMILPPPPEPVEQLATQVPDLPNEGAAGPIPEQLSPSAESPATPPSEDPEPIAPVTEPPSEQPPIEEPRTEPTEANAAVRAPSNIEPLALDPAPVPPITDPLPSPEPGPPAPEPGPPPCEPPPPGTEPEQPAPVLSGLPPAEPEPPGSMDVMENPESSNLELFGPLPVPEAAPSTTEPIPPLLEPEPRVAGSEPPPSEPAPSAPPSPEPEPPTQQPAPPADMVAAPTPNPEPPTPDFEAPGPRPQAPGLHPHWLLSLFTPAPDDAVDWRRGNYTVLARGGRVDSPAGSGELKKQIQMVAEGSVVYAPTGLCGTAADVAPDGFAHPVFRAGFAVSIPLPEVS